jgi:hypothetical protein
MEAPVMEAEGAPERRRGPVTRGQRPHGGIIILKNMILGVMRLETITTTALIVLKV